ncbi:MAG: UDP-glucose--hexose-1-phosphate uridylyltransferase [Oscillospiraceae bacterium]|nr:UDP-glucose--hexose-1-phosphate uridylyltransferase [Oscillospiraceae bacterium]
MSAIDELIEYGARTGLLPECERIFARNLLLDAMGEVSCVPPEPAAPRPLAQILADLTDEAVRKGLAADTAEGRDLFDTRLMSCLTPRPAEVRRTFSEKYAVSPEAAADWFYKFSQDTNYIRRDRIRRDRKWVYPCEYGGLDITINLSKPEKDPRDIAAALKSRAAGYPACALCAENEGYAGRIGHPARGNHRVIPVTLAGDEWYFQYSPYVYYNEHCIALNSRHIPMHIDRETFERLFAFVGFLPHYFIGSNADLPIVGGSILTHDHFQGGRYTFAVERAPVETEFSAGGFPDVVCGVVKWPMTVLRLRGSSPERLTELSCRILEAWRGHTDEAAGIFAFTGDTPHNTITPIVRRRGAEFEIDLVLRNNRTSPEHPLGVFHPHAELHHIKKENIGLIEVMGLAVLPARLDRELAVLEELIPAGGDVAADARVSHHAAWAAQLREKYGRIDAESVRAVLEKEVGAVFLRVLEDAGVYKRTQAGRAALGRFLEKLK